MSVDRSPDWREQTRNVPMIHQSLLQSEGGESWDWESFCIPHFWDSTLSFYLHPFIITMRSWAHFELSELIVSICLIVSLFIISKINLLFYISCGNLQKLDAVEDRRAQQERTNFVSFCVNVCGQKAICWNSPAFYSFSLAPSSRHGAWWLVMPQQSFLHAPNTRIKSF